MSRAIVATRPLQVRIAPRRPLRSLEPQPAMGRWREPRKAPRVCASELPDPRRPKTGTQSTISAMRTLLSAALICAALTVPGQAQNASAGRELESILKFETEHKGTSPLGWGGGPPGTIFVDGEIVHDGRWSVRLERTPASPQMFSTLTKAVPVEFGGTTIEWRGFLRSENVSDFMGLWMRQDGDTPESRVRDDAAAADQRHQRLDGILNHLSAPPRSQTDLLRGAPGRYRQGLG